MLKLILQMLASIASFFQQKQLLDAGKNEEKLNTLEAENEATQTAKDIKADNAKLNVVSITDKLSKYERD